MLYTIIAVITLAAIFGLTILVKLISSGTTPKTAVFTHGALAATGLVLLVIYVVRNPGNSPIVSLVLFVLAALGGFYLFYNDFVKKSPGPVAVAILHALLAVSGFVLLLVFAFA